MKITTILLLIANFNMAMASSSQQFYRFKAQFDRAQALDSTHAAAILSDQDGEWRCSGVLRTQTESLFSDSLNEEFAELAFRTNLEQYGSNLYFSFVDIQNATLHPQLRPMSAQGSYADQEAGHIFRVNDSADKIIIRAHYYGAENSYTKSKMAYSVCMKF